MKTKRNLVIICILAGLGFLLTSRASAQTFTNLYSFSALNGPYPGTNSDGAWPVAGLVLSGNTLYGTTSVGGSAGNGTVFAINNNGSGLTNLHVFTAVDPVGGTNDDGVSPQAGLILSSNVLYGTTVNGGSAGNGTVFALTTGGTFKTLHNFTAIPAYPHTTNTDGGRPVAGLVLSSNVLYGTANVGGTGQFGFGTVFAVSTAGVFLKTLHSFTDGSDGSEPQAGLVLSGGTLYGTAGFGGVGLDDNGTVFAVNADGTGFTTLHIFTRLHGVLPATNTDGAAPQTGLVVAGDTLYGTTSAGGFAGAGTVFAVRTNVNATDFTNLHNFGYGANPSGLILSGNTLYGTTQADGSASKGTVFSLHTDGTDYTVLHTFSGTDGASPQGGLILSGNTLLGTTKGGGTNNTGTVFSLTLPTPPQLAITASGTNVIVTWPTNATGFTLQSTTNLASPPAWSTNLPAPVVVNGHNTVTNAISGAEKFYRLGQ